MKHYNITVNGTAYDVVVDEIGAGAAPAAAPAAAPKAAAPVAAPAAAPKAAPVQAAAPATPATPAPAPAVAVRGGLVFTTVALVPGKVYRTKAPHNVAWWQQIATACAKGPAQVAPLLASPTNPSGVPVAFFGYCVRRGYLQAV